MTRTTRAAAFMAAALFFVLAGCSREQTVETPSAGSVPEVPEYTFTVDPTLLQEERALNGSIALRVPVGWQVYERETDIFRQFVPQDTPSFELELVAIAENGAALIAGTYRDETSPDSVTQQVTQEPEERDRFYHNGLDLHQALSISPEAALFVFATATPGGTVTIQFALTSAALDEATMRQVESAIGSIRPISS